MKKTLDDIFKKYEHVGIPYRGRCDEINNVFTVLLANLSEKNDSECKILISDLCEFRFIKDIIYDGKSKSCIIEFDQGSVSFSYVPDSIKSRFGKKFYDKKYDGYCFAHQCHSVTSTYLHLNQGQNLRAITSLCVDSRFFLFFHSYIWDVDNDLIIDFSRNLMMKKKDYDYLFVTREINVFDYDDYIFNIAETDYRHCGEDYCRLLYLALVKLYNEQNQSDFNPEKPPKTLNYCMNSFSRNFLNNGL